MNKLESRINNGVAGGINNGVLGNTGDKGSEQKELATGNDRMFAAGNQALPTETERLQQHFDDHIKKINNEQDLSTKLILLSNLVGLFFKSESLQTIKNRDGLNLLVNQLENDLPQNLTTKTIPLKTFLITYEEISGKLESYLQILNTNTSQYSDQHNLELLNVASRFKSVSSNFSSEQQGKVISLFKSISDSLNQATNISSTPQNNKSTVKVIESIINQIPTTTTPEAGFYTTAQPKSQKLPVVGYASQEELNNLFNRDVTNSLNNLLTYKIPQLGSQEHEISQHIFTELQKVITILVESRFKNYNNLSQIEQTYAIINKIKHLQWNNELAQKVISFNYYLHNCPCDHKYYSEISTLHLNLNSLIAKKGIKSNLEKLVENPNIDNNLQTLLEVITHFNRSPHLYNLSQIAQILEILHKLQEKIQENKDAPQIISSFKQALVKRVENIFNQTHSTMSIDKNSTTPKSISQNMIALIVQSEIEALVKNLQIDNPALAGAIKKLMGSPTDESYIDLIELIANNTENSANKTKILAILAKSMFQIIKIQPNENNSLNLQVNEVVSVLNKSLDSTSVDLGTYTQIYNAFAALHEIQQQFAVDLDDQTKKNISNIQTSLGNYIIQTLS